MHPYLTKIGETNKLKVLFLCRKTKDGAEDAEPPFSYSIVRMDLIFSPFGGCENAFCYLTPIYEKAPAVRREFSSLSRFVIGMDHR